MSPDAHLDYMYSKNHDYNFSDIHNDAISTHVLLDPLSLCGFTTLSHTAGYRDSPADWASENEMKIHFLTYLPGMKIN